MASFILTKSIKNLCTVDECLEDAYQNGWCVGHADRMRRRGRLTVKHRDPIIDTPERYFWKRVTLTSNPDKCWEWACGPEPNGYGRVQYEGRAWRTHRLAWFLTYGDVPALLMHSCDNPLCCNPLLGHDSRTVSKSAS